MGGGGGGGRKSIGDHSQCRVKKLGKSAGLKRQGRLFKEVCDENLARSGDLFSLHYLSNVEINEMNEIKPSTTLIRINICIIFACSVPKIHHGLYPPSQFRHAPSEIGRHCRLLKWFIGDYLQAISTLQPRKHGVHASRGYTDTISLSRYALEIPYLE